MQAMVKVETSRGIFFGVLHSPQCLSLIHQTSAEPDLLYSHKSLFISKPALCFTSLAVSLKYSKGAGFRAGQSKDSQVYQPFLLAW